MRGERVLGLIVGRCPGIDGLAGLLEAIDRGDQVLQLAGLGTAQFIELEKRELDTAVVGGPVQRVDQIANDRLWLWLRHRGPQKRADAVITLLYQIAAGRPDQGRILLHAHAGCTEEGEIHPDRDQHQRHDQQQRIEQKDRAPDATKKTTNKRGFLGHDNSKGPNR